MKMFIILCSVLLLSACASTKQSEPTEFKTGKEVKPPYGCIELRKQRQDANC